MDRDARHPQITRRNTNRCAFTPAGRPADTGPACMKNPQRQPEHAAQLLLEQAPSPAADPERWNVVTFWRGSSQPQSGQTTVSRLLMGTKAEKSEAQPGQR